MMKEGLIAFLKLLFFLLILPLVYAVTVSFQTQILGLPASQEAWLLAGVVVYVLLNLFVYDFKQVYLFGQQITSKVFSFLEPMVGVAGFVIPIYTVLLILIKLFLTMIGRAGPVENYLLFAIAFSFAMHLVLAAREVHESDGSPLKAQYFFGFGVVYIVNIILVALLLGCSLNEFSFLSFIKSTAHQSYSVYKDISRFLFVD